MKLYSLKVNERLNPLGIDTSPYFSWKIESGVPGVLQTAYRIEIPGFWDTGKVESRQQAFVPYEGASLLPCTAYTWILTVWDNQGREASAAGSFETALPNWQAKWVESSILRNAKTYDYASRSAENILDETKSGLKPGAPAILFERTFCLAGKEIARARIYATAYGVYRLAVNGQRPDDREFAPEFTSYEKRHYYQIYDVTHLLQCGKNRLSMYVGDGWYFSDQATPVLGERRDAMAVLYQLQVWYADGSVETIASDGSETCAVGFVTASDIFVGESQDLRRGFDDKKPVILKEYPLDALLPQPMDPVLPAMLLPAVEVFTTPKGETVVDFGQVLAGRARIHLDIPVGQEAVFQYFEILDKDGNFINTMYAPQMDRVVSAGEPVLHEALFTFHGFRYIKVAGVEHVCKEDFTAVLLTSQKENAGEFTCSDARLNRLYENVRWSQRNNMMSVPTDCPSREKAGWTGDILIYARTALINENVSAFLSAWLGNVRADMSDEGVVMITSPFEKLYDTLVRGVCAGFGDTRATNVAGWSDAILWVPYEMYRVTGNKPVLRENFDAMTRFCDNLIATANSKGTPWLLDTGFHFGESLIPSEPVGGFEICKQSAYYVAPMFAYMSMIKMAEVCNALGEDGTKYEAAAANMKQAILEYVQLPDKMGAYVLAFAFGLVPPEKKEHYKDRLLTLIRENGNCLDTGFLTTPFLLDVLFDLGEIAMAQTLLWQDKLPSWLYEVDNGATAIWEAWNADEAKYTGRFVSFDHYAFGCVDDYLCCRICGIDSNTPGFDNVVIAPQKDDRITWFRRKLDTVHGPVEVIYQDGALNVTIPPNCTAEVRWKGKYHKIGSGRYDFS